MKKIFVSFCMASALVSLLSCKSSRHAVSASVIDGEWNIIEVNGTVVVPAPGQEFPYIGFDTESGELHGSSGCNRMMGTFNVNGKPGHIDLGAIATTRMACPDMTIEQNVLSALAQAKTYKSLDKKNIAFYGSSNRPVAVLQKKLPDAKLSVLAGKWLISKVNNFTIPEKKEDAPFIEFDIQRMKLHGNAGCNIINGSIIANEEDPTAISFSQIISTMMACPNLQVEGWILKALDKVRFWSKQEDGSLSLFDENQEIVLQMTAAEK